MTKLRPDGWPRLDREAVGMVTTTTRKIRNAFLGIPIGTEITITGTYRGKFNIEARTCFFCKVEAYVNGVDRSSLKPPATQPA